MKNFAKAKNKFYFCTRKRKIGLWCNGNTTDSGPVIPGSNPGSPTRRRLFQVVFFFVLCYQDSFSLSRLGRLVCGCQMCSVAFATVEYRLRISAQTSLGAILNQSSKPSVSLHIFLPSVCSRLLPPVETPRIKGVKGF